MPLMTYTANLYHGPAVRFTRTFPALSPETALAFADTLTAMLAEQLGAEYLTGCRLAISDGSGEIFTHWFE